MGHTADERHGDAVDAVREAKRRIRIEVGDVIGEGRAGHAH